MVANLVPGQYQIGDLIMGRHTAYKVTGFDIQPYGVAAQDYQVPFEDITRFGNDQITPGPINLSIEVLQNRWISEKPDTGQYLINGSLSELQRIWRGDEIRYSWGEMMPLYFCGRDGITKAIYGRPGKFTYPKGVMNADGEPIDHCYEVIAEFRRGDTIAYAAEEVYTEVLQQDAPTIVYQAGNANSWVRILLTGPMTNPVITIGDQQVKLDLELEDGEVLEVSSYPWRRRVVDSNGINQRAQMTGVNYLNKLIIPWGVPVPVRWTSEEVNTWQPALGNRKWYETIDDIKKTTLPSTFTNISGKVIVGHDLFNKDFYTNYLRGNIGTPWRAVCRYNERKYNTRDQVCYATLVNPSKGRNGIIIMSNDALTNFLMLEVKAENNSNYLRIRTGSGPTTFSSVRSEYHYTARNFEDGDIAGIRSDYNSGTGDTTYTMTFNDSDVGTPWTDTSNVVSSEATNRTNAFAFNLDNSGWPDRSGGFGFKDIVGYDHKIVPTPVGQVFVCWRNAYQVIE